jgi:pimeloyl-ACP methyl ester carboxylesterase
MEGFMEPGVGISSCQSLKRGFRTITVDLPIKVPELGASAYAHTVVDALPEDEAVVVIGHSMGGMVISLIPERRPVSRLIFLTASMPVPGLSAADQYGTEPDQIGSAQGVYITDAERQAT